MNKKAKILGSFVFVIFMAAQLSASESVSKKTWDEALVQYTKKTISVIDRIDRYSHGAMAIFASCCVAPWLALNGKKTEAISLGAHALGNFGVRFLADRSKQRFERWASLIPPKKTQFDYEKSRFDSVKYQAAWYPLPFMGIRFLELVLRQSLTSDILHSINLHSISLINGARNQKTASALDAYIELGGLAFGMGHVLFYYILPVCAVIQGVGIKMLWQAIEKNRYYGKDLGKQLNKNMDNIESMLTQLEKNKN